MKIVMTGFAAIVLFVAGQSCSSKQDRYVDLNTGTAFNLVKHPQTGLLVDAETGKPLNIYIDRASNDTIDGRTGKIINGQVEKIDNSYYVYAGTQVGNNTLPAGTLTAAR